TTRGLRAAPTACARRPGSTVASVVRSPAWRSSARASSMSFSMRGSVSTALLYREVREGDGKSARRAGRRRRPASGELSAPSREAGQASARDGLIEVTPASRRDDLLFPKAKRYAQTRFVRIGTRGGLFEHGRMGPELRQRWPNRSRWRFEIRR